MSRRARRSRIAAAVAAVRRHRRRMARAGAPPVPVRAAAVVAVREAAPRTLGGLAAQQGTLAAVALTRGAVTHRATVGPLALTGAVGLLAAGPAAPVAAGLAVLGTSAGVVARQSRPGRLDGDGCVIEEPGRLWTRARGVAWWSAGCLGWMGAGTLGATAGLPWWQSGGLLVAAAAPGIVLARRALPEAVVPEVLPAPVGPPPHVPPAAWLLGETLERICEADRSPIEGARVAQVLYPAEGVAVAEVDLPGGMHVSSVRPELRTGLEALLARSGRGLLGELAAGQVRIEAAAVDRLRITVSWSKALDEGALPWRSPAQLAADGLDLAPGQVWLGIDDTRAPMVVSTWDRGDDGKVSVYHMWIIGQTNGGKSTTIRALLAPGVISGCELPILIDGKGDSLADLTAWGVGGHVARGADAWRQGIALAYAIMVARQQRLGGPHPWNGPTPDDPIITVVIDEYTTVMAGLLGTEFTMLGEIARMGRSLGVRLLLSGQNPLVDSLPGGSDVRPQFRVILGHCMGDSVQDRIALQAGGEESPSLRGLPVGRVVAVVGGAIVARYAKVALLREAELTAAAADSPRARLHADDVHGHVTALLALADTWGTSVPAPVVDLSALLAEWDITGDLVTEPGTGGTDDVVVDLTDRIPTQTRPSGSLRDWILTQLLTRPGTRRAEIVGEAVALGWSRSGAYRAIDTLIAEDAVAEDAAGQLVPAAWSTR